MSSRHGQDVGLRCGQDDRHQIFGRVVWHFLEHEGAKRDGAIEANTQGVTIGRRFGHEIHADGAASAGFVFDHERLAPAGFKSFGHTANDDIQRTASRCWHDDLDRLGGPCTLC